MDVVINHGVDQVIFDFIEGPIFHAFNKTTHNLELHRYNSYETKPTAGEYVNLKSKHKKVVMMMPQSIYHFFNDFIGKILKQFETDKKLEVIVSKHVLENAKPGKHIYRDALDLLESVGIKVTVIDTHKYDGLEVDNAYIFTTFHTEQNYEKALYKAALTLVKNKNAAPHRKVFLSRRLMGDRQHASENLPIKHDNRIDSHDHIENYFRSLGYEIVVPEHFTSLAEQINFFYEVKIIASTTSSGLINAAFMQDGQTVVELQTPLIVYMPPQAEMVDSGLNVQNQSKLVATEQLHFFYSKISFQKNHKYVAINNYTRSSRKIEETIQKDSQLKALIQGDYTEQNSSLIQQERKKSRWLKR